MAVHQILLVVSLVLFAIAAFVPATYPADWRYPKLNLGWLGAAFLTASFLF